jgi:Fur family transcriptional regulator, ferric uptake regulator
MTVPKRADIASSEALRSVIRSAGLRSTSARVAVLEILGGRGAPVSHSELAEDPGLGGYDRATIYRNLMDLADAGLLSRSDLGDHVWRFELKDRGHAADPEHPHFVCTDCGTVSCLDDVRVEVKAKKRSPRREISEVLLKGRCEHCV